MNDLARAEVLDRNRFARPEPPRRSAAATTGRHPRTRWCCCSKPAPRSATYAPIMRALFTFGAYTLMRPGELMALNWADIDLDAGATAARIISRRLYRGMTDLPKSNRERTITIVAPARAALDSLLELPRLLPRRARVPQQDRRAAHRPDPHRLLERGPRPRAPRPRLLHSHQTLRRLVHEGRLGLPDAAIAAQAGWSEQAVTKMVATYAHAVDERRLDEIDAAFGNGVTQIVTQTRSNRPFCGGLNQYRPPFRSNTG